MRRDIIERVGLGLVEGIDDELDFTELETGDCQIELGGDLEQRLEFGREKRPIPAGLLGKAVVSNDEGSFFRLGHMRQADRRHRGHAEHLRRLENGVAC